MRCSAILFPGFPQAGERFTDPRWRAAAFYQAGQYQQALDALAGQTDAESHYNRGNTLARLKRYDDAVAEYDAALLIDPEHADARHNRDLLLRLSDPPPAAVSDAPGPRAGDSSTDANARGQPGAATSPEIDGDPASTAAAPAGAEDRVGQRHSATMRSDVLATGCRTRWRTGC